MKFYFNFSKYKLRSFFLYFITLFIFSNITPGLNGQDEDTELFSRESILKIMYKVNNYQISQSWKNVDRNWKRATWYTGVMAFYEISKDSNLLNQSISWASKHGWRIGSEWIYPANRLTCSQTYLEIYFNRKSDNFISRTRDYMDNKVSNYESAFDQGWDYVDALYVGTPAYVMMSSATNDLKYTNYANRLFKELVDSLYSQKFHLFYRDLLAKNEKSKNGKEVMWSRGNGWAIASIPRILKFLPDNDTMYAFYVDLLTQMAESLFDKQGNDGLWRTNLVDQKEYPSPETSGSAFFVYALSWGINNGILNSDKYFSTVQEAWHGLTNVVNENGKVCWGQSVARKPGPVDKDDSDEYVTGAFLLAGSEVYKLARNQ